MQPDLMVMTSERMCKETKGIDRIGKSHAFYTQKSIPDTYLSKVGYLTHFIDTV